MEYTTQDVIVPKAQTSEQYLIAPFLGNYQSNALHPTDKGKLRLKKK